MITNWNWVGDGGYWEKLLRDNILKAENSIILTASGPNHNFGSILQNRKCKHYLVPRLWSSDLLYPLYSCINLLHVKGCTIIIQKIKYNCFSERHRIH